MILKYRIRGTQYNGELIVNERHKISMYHDDGTWGSKEIEYDKVPTWIDSVENTGHSVVLRREAQGIREGLTLGLHLQKREETICG